MIKIVKVASGFFKASKDGKIGIGSTSFIALDNLEKKCQCS